MHANRLVSLVAPAALALVLGGCASADKGQVTVPNPRTISGENREWWDVYSLEFQGDRKIRTKMGYLYRKYDQKDPKGKYWVLDANQATVGFILPESYQAFTIQPPAQGMLEPKAQPVGTTDLHSGIKRILQVPGTVELDKVQLKTGELTKS